MKKVSLTALILMLAFTMALSACSSDNKKASTSNGDEKAVKITLLNSKPEIQQQLLEAAQTFTKSNPDITIDVITSTTNQSPTEKATLLYASGTPATLTMLDAGDIEKFKDKAADLSGEKWASDMAGPNQIDGQTLAFPFAVEGYGILYNKAVVEKALGGAFDPQTITSFQALEDLFAKIQASGTVPFILGPMDWSLGNHFLAIAYAAQPDGDVAKFLSQLRAGGENLADSAAFNGLMNTFDLLKKYNSASKDPFAVTYEQTAAAVAKGEAAMTFNGNWIYGEIQKTNATGEFGFIPVPISNDAADKANSGIAIGATKQIFIDKTTSTAAQQSAAKKFLEWLVYDLAGQDFLVNKANIIPAFKNINLEPKDPLAKSIKAYSNAGNAIAFAGNYVPGDHWKVLGASMQKYMANKIDKNELATDIQTYWKKVQ